MIRIKTIPILFLFISASFPAKGQEVVVGLQYNRELTKEIPNARSSVTDTLELPFIDDFSYTDVYPDDKRWGDNFVFINNTYSNQQITQGVATFDIIDNSGRMYENASAYSFEADKLTSLPINLEYAPSDNVVLSFFYEAGGVGDRPEITDKLTLHFFVVDEERWEQVWENETVDFDGFKPVAIPIIEERFLKKGFRFRFINHATLSNITSDPSMVGNSDQWNVDYVKLDKGRDVNDTIVTDVAFRYLHRSLLKSHEAMPWKQFKEISFLEMGTTFTISYRNNDTITRNVTREFEITDIYSNTVVKTFSGGATNIQPLSNIDYEVGHFYTFSSTNNDSALFKIKSWLKSDEFDRKENDTITYYQHFTNYFAYDDGSAESGYGINGLGSSNAMAAVKFRSFVEDTIYAIDICFNDSYRNRNLTEFTLMIWDDNQGQPGNVLLQLEDRFVKQGEEVNGFHTYKLPYPVPVNGFFYIGWKQQSELFLNVGLDLNTAHEGKQLFWINGTWSLSQVAGTIMIRPLTVRPIITSLYETPTIKESAKFELWPNPANDYINIDTREYIEGSDIMVITDLSGREVIRKPLSEQTDITSLPKGFYIVTIIRNGRQMGYNRLIKTR